jgi:GT2 family glycosyltransferase
MSVLIVTVNYKTPQETIRCIESALKLERSDWQMAIVENGSHDSSSSDLLSWFSQKNIQITPYFSGQEWPNSQFVWIESEQNLGFAGGNNLAIRPALKSASLNWVWLLNNDAQATPNSLDCLLNCALKNPKSGVLGSQLFDDQEPFTSQGLGGRLSSLHGRAQHIHDVNELAYLDYVVGASMLIRRDVFDQIGLMSEDYFLYYEEADLCHKAKKAGFEILSVPESRVFHACGASSTKPIREYYYVRNLLNFTKKYRKDLFLQSLFYVLWTRMGCRFSRPDLRSAAWAGLKAFLRNERGMRQ